MSDYINGVDRTGIMSSTTGIEQFRILLVTPDPMPTHAPPPAAAAHGLLAIYPHLQTARLESCPDGEAAAEWLNSPGHHADVVLYDLTPRTTARNDARNDVRNDVRNGPEPSLIHVEYMAQFIRRARAQPHLRDLPVIALGDAPLPPHERREDTEDSAPESETQRAQAESRTPGSPATSANRPVNPEPNGPRTEAAQSRRVPAGRAVQMPPDPAQHISRAALYAGAIDYLPYSVNPVKLMHSIETAPLRQRAIAAEVQRQVEERYLDIIGIIQHEFRTPMTLLLGYGEYLRDALDEKLDQDELKLSIEAMLSGSHRLNRLIESFLNLSELQYRRPEQIQRQRVLPEMLWREVQAMLRNEAQESPVDIVHIFPTESTPVEVEPELVREALTRLLDNALHYTRAESREVRLAVETSDEWVRWIIEDEGTGIEADQLEHILEPFGRGEGKRFMPRSAGLSLAIVKRIAELHGGSLSVASRLREGSRFVLQLPRQQAEG